MKDYIQVTLNTSSEEDKEIPAQATGQLRSSSNFRLTPDRTQNENIMMRLDSGSSFEIVGWKRVPKSNTSESIESDVAPKAGSAQQGAQNRDPVQLAHDLISFAAVLMARRIRT